MNSALDPAAAEIVSILELVAHPEGGRFAESWRAPATTGSGRSGGTAIYFLLTSEEVSHWHRVDATEIWHYYAGAPLELRTAGKLGVIERILGPDLTAGARPQLLVEPEAWQSARSTGAWSLVGCTVVPGFEFAGFELAPPGWDPPVATGPTV